MSDPQLTPMTPEEAVAKYRIAAESFVEIICSTRTDGEKLEFIYGFQKLLGRFLPHYEEQVLLKRFPEIAKLFSRH
jgi:hypothetical protein